MGVNEMCNFYMMFYRDANSPDPFPRKDYLPILSALFFLDGGACGGNEDPETFALEYPVEGTTLLPRHPELEHAAHQDSKAFGVVEKAKISKIGRHRLGQISGLSFDRAGKLVIFHRADRVWDGNTFGSNNQLIDRTPISEPVLLLAKDSKNHQNLELEAAYGKHQPPHGLQRMFRRESILSTSRGVC